MTTPFQYKEVAELMGSWPIATLKDPAPAQQLQPSSLNVKATMVGSRREIADGYLIGGTTMDVFVDIGGTPTQHVVTFAAGGGSGLTTDHYTLAEVIAAIQASAPPLPVNTAQNSDNYLLIQSQTIGEDSYLRLESISGAEGIFDEFGLQPGIIVRGGGIKDAQSVDPSRQSARPGQLAMMHGENFSADVLNRMSLQLGINAGQTRGTVDLRRVAVRKEEDFAGSGAAGVQLNTGSPNEAIYTGPISTPTVAQLKKTIVVLDDRGNEFTKEMEDAGSIETDVDYSFDSDAGEQIVTSPSIVFLSTDPDGNWYVIPEDTTVNGGILNDIPLKIIRWIGANTVVVDPVDPADGVRYEINDIGATGRRSQIFNVKCEVEGFFSDGGFTTPVEQVQVPVTGGAGAITRIETANRIFVSGATFTTNVKPGDLVEWAGSGATNPYSNDGNYRVAVVVDDKRLELVDDNYNPVILNPSIGVAVGSVTVKSDGDFFLVPFVEFVPATLSNFNVGRGAIPASGDNFTVVYMAAQSLKDAVVANPAIFTNDLEGELEATGATQSAIMRIIGPSISKFDALLHGKEMLNFDFLGKEHHPSSGRHSTIRPDVIEMYPEVTGVTVNVRSATADADDDDKVRFLTELGVRRFSFTAEGRATVWESTGASVATLFDITKAAGALEFKHAGSSERYRVKMSSNNAGSSLLTLGVEDNGAAATVQNVLSVNKDGSFGVNLAGALADTGFEGEPQTNFHVRGRDAADTELMRFEGFDDSDNTVAWTFKPRLLEPFYGFVEMDHDNPGGVGDWLFNFVITTDANADSDGTEGVAFFRWVDDAGGSPAELLRLGSFGATLSVDAQFDDTIGGRLIGSAVNAAIARMEFPWRNVLSNATNVFKFPAGGSSTFPGVELWKSSGLSGLRVLSGLTWDGNNTYDLDASGNTLNPWFWAIGTQNGGLSIHTADSGAAFPGTGALFDKDFDIVIRDKSGLGAGTIVQLLDGRLRFLNPTTTSNGSNPPDTTNITANTLYAKNIVKAWVLILVNGGSASVAATGGGFNLDSPTPVAVLGTGVDVNWDEAFTGVDDYIVSCQMERSTTVVGATTYSFTTLAAKTTSDCTVQPVREGGFAIDCSDVGQDFHLLVAVMGQQA